MPAYAGVMDISARRLRAIEKWADDTCERLHRGLVRRGAKAIPDIERVSVTTRNKESDPALGYFLQLYTDGAASAAAQLFTQDLIYGPGQAPSGIGIFGDDLVRTAAECLRVVVAHASLNTGVRGDALVRCSLIFGTGPAQLGYAHYHDEWEQYEPSRPIAARGAPVGTPRGIDIDAVLNSPAEWMSATRLMSTDLFHAFGQPEVLQITESGAFNTNYWRPNLLDGWKLVEKVPRVSEQIRFR